MLTLTRIVTFIKSVIAQHVFDKIPELKKELWGSNLWTSGYYASTVVKHGNETVIANYVKEQGRAPEYVQIHKDQLRLL
jgi:putative transposase